MRLLAVVVLLGGAPAWADERDRPASVTAKLAGATAHLTARFDAEIELGHGVHFESIALPAGGLVTAATAVIRGMRHPLRLESAETAQRTFDGLAVKPPGDERAWAIMLSGDSTSVMLDALFPVTTKLAVELAVDAPTCFFHDARYVLVPASWHARIPAALRGPLPDGLDQECASIGIDEMKWIGFASRQREGAERIGILTGRLAVAAAHLARFELDLAAQLTTIPSNLYTAIVVDHSRSLTTTQLEAQRALVASYVSGAPASRVQVIAYTRRAQALLPSWMIAAQAAPRIDRALRALAPRNGSNVDAALREAVAWLGRVHGTKRVVLVSDERLAYRFGEEPAASLRALVPPGVLLHVVVPASDDSAIARSDNGVLAALAQATEGIEVTVGAGDQHGVDATMLLRPTSLDNVAIKAPGWETLEVGEHTRCHELDRLGEGGSCGWWGKGNGASGPITIEGLLWNHRFARTVRPDPSQARTLARTLSAANALDGELGEQVDRAALAVNAVWSLFARWGGAGGYEDLGGWGLGLTGRGGGSGSSHDVGFGTLSRGAPLDLHAALQPAVARCHPGNAKVVVTAETTRQEIVDVAVEVKPADAVLQTCVAEAVWDTVLMVGDVPDHRVSVARYP